MPTITTGRCARKGSSMYVRSMTYFDLYQSLNWLPIWNSQNCNMFPLTFVAGSLQGHWWGFISRNYVVWPIFFLINVFIALKATHFWSLCDISQAWEGPSQYLVRRCSCVLVCFFWWLIMPIFVLNCLLQLEQVDSENDDSDDDPFCSGFALFALSFCFAGSLCFIVICSLTDEATPLCSIQCNLFPGLWWYVEIF